jgi:phospholipid/cholesterol/gamma-HCH transport system substrate-binding protein
MRSRVVREGSVGLLILLGLGFTVGIAAWLRGVSFGGNYSLAVELADAVGLNVGSPVKYRGVKVGRVNSLTPSINGVTAQVDISPPSLVIPRGSSVSVTPIDLTATNPSFCAMAIALAVVSALILTN